MLIGLGVALALVMTEDGFSPTAAADRSTFAHLAQTLRDAGAVLRRQPILLTLAGIGVFFGLYSEGLDRLETPHLLSDYTLPGIEAVGAVVWMGGVRAVSVVASLAANRASQRWVATSAHSMGRFLTVATAGIILGVAGFGLAQNPWVAVACLIAVGAIRAVHYPLHQTWVNEQIDDPQVRATLLSVSGQVDAVGQILGGPAVGAVANRSIRTALVVSAALLAPAAPLYAAASKRFGRRATKRKPEVSEV
jgi:DHA3 family tetracycline resistance protein-like MFS transporter